MSRVTKIVLGAGAFLVMSGGLLALTGWATGANTHAMGGVHFGSSGTAGVSVPERAPDPAADRGVRENTNLGPFSKVDVDIDLGEVIITPGETYGVSLDWSGDGYWLTYEMDGDTLKVRSNGGFRLEMPERTATAYVYVPQDAALEKVDAHTALGDIDLSGVTVREAELSDDLGNISGYDFTAGELTVKCSLGDIYLSDVSAGSAELTNHMGNIDAFELTTSRSLVVDADMGSVDLQGDFQGETDVKNSMGNVTLSLAQPESAYAYDLEVDMGELSINGEAFHRNVSGSGSPHSLTAETNMGDLSLWFEGE